MMQPIIVVIALVRGYLIECSLLQVEKLGRDCFFILTESFAFDEVSFGAIYDKITSKKPMVVSRATSYVFSLYRPTDPCFGDHVAALSKRLREIQKN